MISGLLENSDLSPDSTPGGCIGRDRDCEGKKWVLMRSHVGRLLRLTVMYLII